MEDELLGTIVVSRRNREIYAEDSLHQRAVDLTTRLETESETLAIEQPIDLASIGAHTRFEDLFIAVCSRARSPIGP